MAVIERPLAGSTALRVGGAFTAVFSVVVGVIILFALPVACSFVGGLELIILGFLFIIGVLAFFIGVVLSWRKRRKLTQVATQRDKMG